MKKIKLFLTLAFVYLFSLTAFGADAVPVYVDGKQIQTDVPAQIIEGRTMLPIRAIFENLGLEVQWDGDTKQAIGSKENTHILLKVGENTALVNGKEVSLDVPALIVDGRTLAPVRFVAESCGYEVVWTENKEVFLNSPKAVTTDIPEYTGNAYTVLNNNKPSFDELSETSFETYGELDNLGRCTAAYACIGKDIMPTEERGSISSVKPSGWHLVKYQGIDGNYLYNRCHLIGYQLSGENANEKNLITGTRYMNTIGMLPFENEVSEYVKKTSNHVMYRVTPLFEGDDLLAKGVQMEAFSVEDEGRGVSFNVFCHNIQPGIEIDYTTGDSKGPEFTGSENKEESFETEDKSEKDDTDESNEVDADYSYVLNTNTMKYHLPTCDSVTEMKAKNRENTDLSKEEIENMGYVACKSCHPDKGE